MESQPPESSQHMKPEDAMPWIGLYVGVASLICTLAMVVDAFQGFRQRRRWLPCRLFTINAVFATLIPTSMKLPVDLTTKMPGDLDQVAKYFSILFLVIMVANFLPSLGLLGDKDLLTNVIAFGIILVTITVNVFIQSISETVYVLPTGILLFIVTIVLPLSVSFGVPSSRRILEHRYKVLHEKVSTRQEKNFSYEELVPIVKKYWIMAETGNPQFVIASSSVSYAYGVICSVLAAFSLYLFIITFGFFDYGFEFALSDYKWSMNVILTVQTLGVILGSIAPIFRCFTAVSHFDKTNEWAKKQLNVFKVDEYWTQRLHHWKLSHVPSYIPGFLLKRVFSDFRNMILNFCIALQITLVVICNMIGLLPKCSLILLSRWWHCLFLPKGSDDASEIKEYKGYVVQFDESSQISDRVLKNILNSITKLIKKSEKKTPKNLLMLLKKSKGFDGVLKLDRNIVPQKYLEKPCSWSLELVTFTTIAIALPNIENRDVKELLSRMRDGLQFVGCIEEKLINAHNDEVGNARKTSRRVWNEVEVYNKWLQIDLRKKARNGETSKMTIDWLGEEAQNVEKKFESSKNDSLDVIAASSMYRISKMILHHYNEHQNWPEDKDVFAWISTQIADILCACFTNLPRVIKMMCHHDAIEKREDGVLAAAQLLGKSKEILEFLEHQPLPNRDRDSMADIEKWFALPRCEI